MTVNSRDKGARGERELRDFIRSYGYRARRGQQNAGGPDSPDVIHDIPGLHVECKRVERGSAYEWLEQAIRDAGDKTPVVFHKRNRREWIVILRAKDFMKMCPPPLPPEKCFSCIFYAGGICCEQEWVAE